jgi:hypothetical protein
MARKIGTIEKNVNEHIGEKYGRLTVLEYSHFKQYAKGKHYVYKCKCECGNETNVAITGLRSGKTKSCGCYARELKIKKEGESATNRTYIGYSSNAKLRGYEFNLTKDEFLEIVSKECYYCNSKPSNKTSSKYNTGDFIYNGIDRVDNKIGYEYSNCVPCCKICNIAKHDMTSEEFLQWISNVYNHSINKK